MSLIAEPRSESIPVAEIPIAANFGGSDLGWRPRRKSESIGVGRPEGLIGGDHEREKTRWKPGKLPADDRTGDIPGCRIVELLLEIAGKNLTAEQADQAGPDAANHTISVRIEVGRLILRPVHRWFDVGIDDR